MEFLKHYGKKGMKWRTPAERAKDKARLDAMKAARRAEQMRRGQALNEGGAPGQSSPPRRPYNPDATYHKSAARRRAAQVAALAKAREELRKEGKKLPNEKLTPATKTSSMGSQAKSKPDETTS